MSRFQLTTMLNHTRCRKTGSQIAELPPALILLLVMMFFPFLDILYLAVAYGAGWYLNQIEARQISFSKPQASLTSKTTGSGASTVTTYSNSKPYSFGSDSGNTQLPQSVSWNGFMGVTEAGTSPTATYLPSSTGSTSSQPGKVQVVTSVSVKPFLSQTSTWLPKVPGLNEALTFEYTDTVYQEDQN